MKRRIFAWAGIAVAATSVAVLAPKAPAESAELVEVCFTLQPRAVGVFVGGTQILGETVVGVPRTCVGI